MKILIFGIVGSGKTTLAKRLSKKLDIPFYEGDCIAWGFPGDKNYKRTKCEQEKIIRLIDEKGKCIIEGTYRECQKVLYDMADKIIFLDTPLNIRLYRIIKRYIKQKLGIEECNYRPSLNMLKNMFKWTKNFKKNRKKHEDRLWDYSYKLIRIKSVKELEDKI